MRKLDLIIENIRDEYMINLLEEGTASELETLKTKKFLNENLSRIRGILVEEGAMDQVKQHLGDNWGKYLAGAGAAGAAGLGNTETGGEIIDQLRTQSTDVGEKLADAAGNAINSGVDAAGNLADTVTDQTPMTNLDIVNQTQAGIEGFANISPEDVRSPEGIKELTALAQQQTNTQDALQTQGLVGAAGLAGAGAAGYGAKKLVDRLRS